MKVIISQSSNFAELQSQFSSPNCIYVIGIEQQTFGTATSPLVIPDNSTLEFIGGKFIGGYVQLNDTVQNDVFYTVWDNVEISGTSPNYMWKIFRNDTLRPEWFGAIGNGVHDDTKALQQSIKLASACGSIVKLSPKRYTITETLQIFSGTHIEGTLPGSIDLYTQTGTSIEVNLTTDNIALDINSANDISGCYKFILRNFSIVMSNSNIPTTALRLYSIADSCPREGLIEGVFVYGFNIGFDLNAFSYVKIQRINISHCTIGINIVKSGTYTEFIWFDNIYINTDAPNAIGINIEDGSYLYFDEIDIAGCIKGLYINSKSGVLNLFANRLSMENCTNSIHVHANSQHITRIKLSEVAIYRMPDNENGIIFSRNMPYNIEDCVFTDLFDASSNNKNFIKIEEIGMSTCTFDGIRTYDKLTGFSNVKKVGLLRIPNSGAFVIPEGTNGYYKYVVSSLSPLDYAPLLMISTQRSIDFNYVCNNTQMGELSIGIDFSGILESPLLVYYSFPQL